MKNGRSESGASESPRAPCCNYRRSPLARVGQSVAQCSSRSNAEVRGSRIQWSAFGVAVILAGLLWGVFLWPPGADKIIWVPIALLWIEIGAIIAALVRRCIARQSILGMARGPCRVFEPCAHGEHAVAAALSKHGGSQEARKTDERAPTKPGWRGKEPKPAVSEELEENEPPG